MAPDDGAFVSFCSTSNRMGMRKDSARMRLGLSVQWFNNLRIKRKFFILNKKDQVCVQTLVYDDKTLIFHRMENFDQSTGQM